MPEVETSKPVLKLLGSDGNAFAILGEARKVARAAKWPRERIETMIDDAMSGDYDHLLQVMMLYFEVR